jgi:hypothetical protein
METKVVVHEEDPKLFSSNLFHLNLFRVSIILNECISYLVIILPRAVAVEEGMHEACGCELIETVWACSS